MKRKIFKVAGLFILIIIALCVLINAYNPASVQIFSPKSLFNNFGKDPKTEHNFTWYTDTSIKTGFLEYCRKDKFNGFDKSIIIKAAAHNYETKTDTSSFIVHKVELNNLTPGTEYIYRVSSNTGSFSQQGKFKTAEKDISSFTFINITDTQRANAKDYTLWKNTLDKALNKFPSARFLLHTGDMVNSGQLSTQWDLFSSAVKSELMNLPITPVVGNHEAFNTNNTNLNEKNFTDRFDIPKELNTGAPSGTVYSFDYGNAHIAVMNTQCGNDNLKQQADWLINDMSKTKRLWKIVALHRGPYGATYDTTDIRSTWAPVFDKTGIDLVISGHDHNYVRSYAMKNNSRSTTGKGTVYVIGNTGGVKFYPTKSRAWQKIDLQPHTQMYIAVTVEKRQLKVKSYDVKNNLKDSFTLQK